MTAARLPLGQMLVGADCVSQAHLDRALAVQGFAGGRIGTLLLERGAVTEEDLGRTLALQHRCEHVPWSVLGAVAPETAAALPARFAIMYAAILYDREENFVKIALRDPSDLRVLDEIFFVVGKKIVVGVAPEVRIYQALEKYYGKLRTPRFAILAEKLSQPGAAPVEATPEPAPPPPPPDFFAGGSDATRRPARAVGEGPASRIPDRGIGGWARLSPSPDPAAQSNEPVSIPWEDSTGVRSRGKPDASGADAKPVAGPVVSPDKLERFQPEPFPQAETAPPPATPDRFPEVLAAADRDSIAAAALSILSRRFPRAALLRSGSQSVYGWAAAGDRVDVAAFRAIEIPWSEPSLFLSLRLSRTFHTGPLPPTPRHAAIATALGGWPRQCIVQPVLIGDRPAAFLYAELSLHDRAAAADIAYLRDLGAATAAALETAIRLKRKEI